MAFVRTRSFIADVPDKIDSIIAILGETEANIFYVSTFGSNSNDGLSLETAFRNIDYAITQCTSGQSYRIFIDAGLYDESATDGVNVNKVEGTIQGIKSPVVIINPKNTTDKVLNITADHCTFVNIQVKKGETVSSGSSCVYINGAHNTRFRDVKIIIEKADFYGYRYVGGASGGYIGYGDRRYSIIIHSIAAGIVPLGIGVYFENCQHVLFNVGVISGMVTGIKFGAEGQMNIIESEVSIAGCTTGIEIESGARDNALICILSACTTNILDNSGNATNDFQSSLTHIHDSIEHIEKFTGTIWFVDVTNGLDTNSGESPEEPFATIGHAINSASEGDAITVKQGDYFETNLDLNLIGIELWGEIGVTIYNTTGTALTLSARNCRVKEIVIVAPGQTALELSGNYCVLEAITCATPAIGISVSGQGNRISDVIIGAPTTTGIDVSGPYNTFREVFASNDDVAARGFYLSSSSAILNVFVSCHSIGNTTAGFETVLGADHNSFIDCTSGGGDGKRLDLGHHNLWVIVERLTTELNEQMHPMSDGEGTAGLPVTVNNTATDDTPDTRSDQNYWGDTVAIIFPDVLTTFWNSLGIFIFATTANKICQWQIWFPNAKYTSDRNAGNAWDLGETQLTVADGTIFLVNDWVWIRSDSHPNGEILIVTNIVGNVITVASETRFSGNTGVRYDHVGNEAMYLIYRPTDDQFTSIEGGYAAGSAKDSFRYIWHAPKELPGNSAMIIRMLNTADALDTAFDVSTLYEM